MCLAARPAGGIETTGAQAPVAVVLLKRLPWFPVRFVIASSKRHSHQRPSNVPKASNRCGIPGPRRSSELGKTACQSASEMEASLLLPPIFRERRIKGRAAPAKIVITDPKCQVWVEALVGPKLVLHQHADQRAGKAVSRTAPGGASCRAALPCRAVGPAPTATDTDPPNALVVKWDPPTPSTKERLSPTRRYNPSVH